MQDVVRLAYEYAKPHLGKGALPEYIPQLKHASPYTLAVALTLPNGTSYTAGDAEQRFTMQSIAKLILLAQALQDSGFDEVFSRVGMEPTGDPFNSIIRLETVNPNKPLNPMINAGAISVTSFIRGDTAKERFNSVLQLARKLLHNPELDIDEKTYESEMEYGDRNRALAYMMRSANIIQGDVEAHLEVYFKACSLFANCTEISVLGAVLANNGVCPYTGECLIPEQHIKVIRTLMCTCGMYDASGEFALKVGVPAKSGVGGGIVGAVPGRIGIGVYSPALDAKGNSLCGTLSMEYLARTLELSIY